MVKTLFARMGDFGFIVGVDNGAILETAADMLFAVDDVDAVREVDLPPEYRHSARWVVETEALVETGPNRTYVLIKDFEEHPVGGKWRPAYDPAD